MKYDAVDVTRGHFWILFVGHRNHLWFMMVLDNIGNQLEGHRGLGRCTGNWMSALENGQNTC